MRHRARRDTESAVSTHTVQEESMGLSAPRQITWIIALILGIVGVVATVVTIPVISGFAVWLVVVGWVILVLATLLEGI
jgi:hypothetical protein